MSEIQADGCRLFFTVEGPPDAPALLLSNSIGTTSALWDRQAGPFARAFRVVRYDTRGHGRSSVPSGDYTMDQLGRDAVATFTAMVAACPPDGYAGCAAAIRDADLREEVRKIAAPTLVITGAADPATPPTEGAFLSERIPGARRVELEAAHLSNVEAADGFTAGVLDFLAT